MGWARRGVGLMVGLVVGGGLACGQQQEQSGPAGKPVVRASDSVTVNADRGLVGVSDSATSVAVVSQQQMGAEPGLTLDDRLHEVAGFQLFRRTSSWTANPTTEGLSLRGLGSTAASRTLVVSDQVPLNDPFGGWVHWDEIPSLGIEDVRLLRGGPADLYGSSAIGGVVDVVPVMPVQHGMVVKADAGGATENSVFENGLVSSALRGLGMLGAYSGLKTDGYIPTAPEFRGTVDVPANVHQESGRVVLRTAKAVRGVRGFVLGNVLNEARGNGTPLQTNGTRLWRYEGGVDADGGWGHGVVRLYGSREAFRQTFSSIAANRNSETLTSVHQTPADEVGLVAQGARTLGDVTAALGVDVRDVRATDDATVTATGVVTSTSARQRSRRTSASRRIPSRRRTAPPGGRNTR